MPHTEDTSIHHKWLQTFYPISANEAAAGSALEAVRHSLQKWRGLSADNMAKYHVQLRGGMLVVDADASEVLIAIASDTCSLCVKYYNVHARSGKTGCETCPIFFAHDRACDDRDLGEWQAWSRTKDPLPMIEVLEATEAYLMSQGNTSVV